MLSKIISFLILTYSIMFLSSFDIHSQNNSNQYSDSLLTLTKKFYNEGLYKKTIELYKDLKIENLSAEELFYLGLCYNNLRENLKAVKYFKNAVETAATHTGFRLQYAKVLTQLGRINEAVSNYDYVIQSDSSNTTALFELGLIYFDKHDYGKSINLFSKLEKLNSNDFISSYYLGYALLLSSNPNNAEPAEKHLEHAVAVNPEYLPAVSLLASSKFSLQKYYDANSLYSIARKLRPENANFQFSSGLCYEKLKFFREAANLYSVAVKLDSTDANHFDHLGFVLFNLNNFDSAAIAYKKASELEDNPTYFVNLGFAYARLDSITKSIESFQKALQLMPIDKISYIYNQIAAVHYSKSNLKESKKNYEKSLVYNPSNSDAQFYIALINEKQKNYKNAISAYRKVIEMTRNDSTQTERINFSNKKIKDLTKKRVIYGK